MDNWQLFLVIWAIFASGRQKGTYDNSFYMAGAFSVLAGISFLVDVFK